MPSGHLKFGHSLFTFQNSNTARAKSRWQSTDTCERLHRVGYRRGRWECSWDGSIHRPILRPLNLRIKAWASECGMADCPHCGGTFEQEDCVALCCVVEQLNDCASDTRPPF